MLPDRFRGIASLPQCAGQPIANTLKELKRCVQRLGFVGCMVNPDPLGRSRAADQDRGRRSLHLRFRVSGNGFGDRSGDQARRG